MRLEGSALLDRSAARLIELGPQATDPSNPLLDERARALEVRLSIDGFASQCRGALFRFGGPCEVARSLCPFARQAVRRLCMGLIACTAQTRGPLDRLLGTGERDSDDGGMRSVCLEFLDEQTRRRMIIECLRVPRWGCSCDACRKGDSSHSSPSSAIHRAPPSLRAARLVNHTVEPGPSAKFEWK
jgi:hypothetical protein